MMYPYKRNEGWQYDNFSMITVQVITHWGPNIHELNDVDEWQIRTDEQWKHSDQDKETYTRNFLYWDEKQWVIEDRDIEIPEQQDYRDLVHAIFSYPDEWVE